MQCNEIEVRSVHLDIFNDCLRDAVFTIGDTVLILVKLSIEILGVKVLDTFPLYICSRFMTLEMMPKNIHGNLRATNFG